MKRKCIVYGLASSEDMVIRYIGQTCGTPRARLLAHIARAKDGEVTYRSHWIRSVMSRGYKIAVITLIDPARRNIDEIELIAKYRSEGADLVRSSGTPKPSARRGFDLH